MKTILSTLLLLTVLSFNALADTDKLSDSAVKLNMTEQSTLCNSLKKDGASPEQLAQRGCCSWHQGVCGCSNGRAACCDGSLSPSCGCHKSDEGKSEL